MRQEVSYPRHYICYRARRRLLIDGDWVWSPQGVIDMHRPETWGYVQFSTAPPGKARFRPDATYPARTELMRLYCLQQAFRQKHRRWASSLQELDRKPDLLRGCEPPLSQMTEDGYIASIRCRLPGGRTGR